VIFVLALLLGNTVTAAAIAVVVLLLCRAFRPSPAVRHALWLVVIVKLLSPAGFIWSVPLPIEAPLWFSQQAKPGATTAESSGSPLLAGVADGQAGTGPTGYLTTLLVQPDDGSPAGLLPRTVDLDTAEGAIPAQADPAGVVPEPDPASSPAEGQSYDPAVLWWWLQVLWLGGAALVACRYLHRTIRFARCARAGQPAEPALEDQVAELAGLLGVRRPRLLVLAELPSPVIWCLLRPVLLWPEGLQDQLRAGGRCAVLIHELAHLRRRDHWIRWLELAAAVLHWWNPLFWFARRQLRLQAELACDAWVTGTLPDMRRDYAEALVEVCARSSRAAVPAPAVGARGDGRRDFRRRLTMIMRDQVPCRLAAGARLCVALLMLAALPAWTFGQAQVAPAPERPVNIRALDLKNLKALTDKIADVDLKDLKALTERIVEVEVKDLKALTDKIVDVDIQFTGADADVAKKVKDLEARIAELQKQLKALKSRRVAAEPTKTVAVWQLSGGGDGRRVIVITFDPATGKLLEWKTETPKKPAKAAGVGQPLRIELQGLDGLLKQQLRLELPAKPMTPKQPQYKVIGPDGKEIKGAKVIIIESKTAPPPTDGKKAAAQKLESARLRLDSILRAVQDKQDNLQLWKKQVRLDPAPVQAGKAVNLSRATYPMPRQRAEALAAFLKDNIKASVLEVKVDDKGLTVTTTPETQAAVAGIAQLLGRVQGQGLRREFLQKAAQ
jgi:beta-lactamase regulating signal transducer with metallopeptidase domain